ncbi:MAG TPA: uroporphyrinogen-III C-methyltransferase [Chloroflexia bacterium]|nr:uroporphyrinogen-III C-methyltransferase [Chloroflexia bacterium]
MQNKEILPDRLNRGVSNGKVYLIGAGPGDPGLLTLKGREVLSRVDTIVYDYLVNPVLLNYARTGAKLIYAGKRAGQACLSQDEINELLVGLGQEGKQVARLKGGDPFVFGRGGEEAEALKEAGISFEIVPGISSAVAVAAYAGIPVTHRDYTSSFTVVTGHEDQNRAESESRLDWEALARTGGTLVFLMGVGKLGDITNRLIEAGLSPLTPAAVIHRGTLWQQQVVSGSLVNIASAARQAGIKPPAITIIGQVAGLREQLRWYDLPELRPLLGKRIIVANNSPSSKEFAASLAELGVHAFNFPEAQAVPVAGFEALDQAITDLSYYDWLFFSSQDDVDYFWQRLAVVRKDSRALAHLKLGVFSAATAQALEQKGILPDVVIADSLNRTQAFSQEFKGAKVLLTGNTRSGSSSGSFLESHGAEVEYLAITELSYAVEDQLPGSPKPVEVARWLETGEVDLLVLSSPEELEQLLGTLSHSNRKQSIQLLNNASVICFGAATANAAREHGLAYIESLPEVIGNAEKLELILEYFTEEEAAERSA